MVIHGRGIATYSIGVLSADNLVVFYPHFADLLLAVLTHFAVLSGGGGLIESYHRSNHTAGLGGALEEVRLQHVLAVVLSAAVITLEGSIGVNQG